MSKASYRYLELARADASFDAWGGTLEEVFEAAGRALTTLMVEPGDVRASSFRRVRLESGTAEGLLFDFLQELVYFKDAERLLFSQYALQVWPSPWRLDGVLGGEPVDPERHRLGVDVKAVTMHRFRLAKEEDGWKATVVVDI